MKLYLLMEIFGTLENLGMVDIIKYHQISGGWHVVIRNLKDGHEYEMTIIPRSTSQQAVFPQSMLN